MSRTDRIKRMFWIVLTVVAGFFSVSVIVENVWHTYKISRRISALEHEQQIYRTRIDEDSTVLEQLKYDEYLERYAREHFRMRRPGERIFIMEQ